MSQILIECPSVVIAILFGLFSLRAMNRFHKLIFIQLTLYFTVYILGYGITFYQDSHRLARNNQWLYNAYMFAETMLLASSIYFQIVSKKRKQFIFMPVGIFLIVFIIQLKSNGLQVFANYAYVTESIALTVLFLLVLFEQFQAIELGFFRSPFILTSLANVIYFGCNAPYFSFFNYLQKSYPNVNGFLFHLIIDVLSNIRHLLLALSFWLIYKQHKINVQDYAE